MRKRSAKKLSLNAETLMHAAARRRLARFALAYGSRTVHSSVCSRTVHL